MKKGLKKLPYAVLTTTMVSSIFGGTAFGALDGLYVPRDGQVEYYSSQFLTAAVVDQEKFDAIQDAILNTDASFDEIFFVWADLGYSHSLQGLINDDAEIDVDAELPETVMDMLTGDEIDPTPGSDVLADVVADINDDNSVTISGVAEGAAEVEVTLVDEEGNESSETVEVDEEGNFEFTSEADLAAGDWTYKVVAFDEEGNELDSEEGEFTIDEVAELPVVESVSAVAGTDMKVTVTGKAENADKVTVSVDGGAEAEATLSEDGSFTYTTDALAAGDHTVSVKAYNGEEVSEAKTATVKVEAPVPLQVESIAVVNISGEKVYNTGDKVATDAQFKVTFKKALDSTTVNTNNVIFYKVSDNSLFPASSVTLSSDKKTVTVTPSATFAANTEYKLVFKKEVKEEGGVGPTEDLTVATFTTSKAAVVTALVDENNDSILGNSLVDIQAVTGDNGSDIEAGEGLRLTYDAPLDGNTVNTSTVKLYNVTDNTQVPVQASLGPQTATSGTININWVGALTTNKKYKLVVNGVKTLLGEEATGFEREFIVGGTAPNAMSVDSLNNTDVTSGDVWPLLTTGTLADGTAQAGLELYVNFNNTNIDPATINATNITLTEKATGAVVPVTVEFISGLNKARIKPSADLKGGTQYTVTVGTGVKNVFGQANTAADTFDFTTYDVTAPTVTSVESSTGSLIGLPVNKEVTLTVKFSEAISAADGTINATTDTTLNNENEEVAIVRQNTTGVIVPTSVTRANNNKDLVIKFTPTVRNATYKLYLAGNTDTAGFASGRFFVDGENPANRLASTYAVTFTTEGNDVTAPTVTGFKTGANDADPFATANTAITSGKTNVIETNDLFVYFDEQLNALSANFRNSTAAATPATDDATDGNIILEAYNTGTGQWTAVDLDHADNEVNNNAVENKGYIRIASEDIPDNSKLRLTIKAKSGNNVLEDAAGNDLTNDYVFEFVTGNGPSVLAQATDPVIADFETTNAAVPAGSTTITVANGGLTSANNNLLAIELADGSFFFTTQNGAIQANTPIAGTDTITINDALPQVVPNGAVVYNLSSVVGTVSTFGSNVSVSDPIAITLQGAAGAKIDPSTIANAVKLYKASDNSVVPATITYKLINNDQDALVSINPSADLEGSTGYYIRVDGLKDELGNEQSAVSKAMKISFETAAVQKQVELSDFNIADNAIGVSTKTNISFKVKNSPLTKAQIEGLFNADELNDTDPVANGDLTLVEVDGNPAAGDNVAATVTYDSTTGQVTIDPTVPLKANTVYRLEIGTQAFGAGAAALTQPKTLTFKTGPAEAPSIVSAKHVEAGAAGLAGDVIILTFDSVVNGTAGTDYPSANGSDFNTFFTLVDGQLSNYVAGPPAEGIASVARSADMKTLTITLAGTAANGDYIINGVTKIAPTVNLKAKDTDAAIPFGTGAIVITSGN